MIRIPSLPKKIRPENRADWIIATFRKNYTFSFPSASLNRYFPYPFLIIGSANFVICRESIFPILKATSSTKRRLTRPPREKESASWPGRWIYSGVTVEILVGIRKDSDKVFHTFVGQSHFHSIYLKMIKINWIKYYLWSITQIFSRRSIHL